jgi:hypothetical protein
MVPDVVIDMSFKRGVSAILIMGILTFGLLGGMAAGYRDGPDAHVAMPAPEVEMSAYYSPNMGGEGHNESDGSSGHGHGSAAAEGQGYGDLPDDDVEGGTGDPEAGGAGPGGPYGVDLAVTGVYMLDDEPMTVDVGLHCSDSGEYYNVFTVTDVYMISSTQMDDDVLLCCSDQGPGPDHNVFYVSEVYMVAPTGMDDVDLHEDGAGGTDDESDDAGGSGPGAPEPEWIADAYGPSMLKVGLVKDF